MLLFVFLPIKKYTATICGTDPQCLCVFPDKVDPPVLTVDSNTSTADPCNMTVTCRTLNTSVSSTCNTTTCSQVGGDRGGVVTSTAALLIYVSGGSIICNHSNQVNWANDTKEIKGLCPLYPTGNPVNCTSTLSFSFFHTHAHTNTPQYKAERLRLQPPPLFFINAEWTDLHHLCTVGVFCFQGCPLLVCLCTC